MTQSVTDKAMLCKCSLVKSYTDEHVKKALSLQLEKNESRAENRAAVFVMRGQLLCAADPVVWKLRDLYPLCGPSLGHHPHGSGWKLTDFMGF